MESLPSTLFTYQDAAVRTVVKDDDPWFVAADICEILEHSDVSVAVSRLDEDEKLIQTMLVSGQRRKLLCVNESGMYNLIFTSRKPEARAFRKWVTSEVLPTLRKTGKYEIPPLAKSITHIKNDRNPYLTMTEEQKLKALDRLAQELRNLAWSVQERELHLHVKLLCAHVFGVLNNRNVPLEMSDQFLKEVFQMRLDLWEEYNFCFPYPEIENKVKDFVYQELAPIVRRMQRK